MTTDLTPDSFTGTCAFRLMPHEELAQAPSGATLGRVGEGLVLRYSWCHPQDGEQQGVLLVGGVPESGPVEAALFDTWHQHPGLMQLTGTREGDRVELEATYLEEWGWQISLDLDGEQASMVMRNVIPESALSMLPPDAPAATAGPYDAMVARWQRSAEHS